MVDQAGVVGGGHDRRRRHHPPRGAHACHDPDEVALTALVTDYWTALFNSDTDALTPLLYEDDRADALEVADPDVAPADPPVEVTVEVTAIRIVEPYAAITNSTMGTRPGEAYAQRFGGQWLLCSDAAFLMPGADGAPGTPTE